MRLTKLAFKFFLALFAGFLFAGNTPYSAAQTPLDRQLIIGTKNAPPFSMQSPDGEWKGISIDLWRMIAADLEIDYTFRELDLNTLVNDLSQGRIDAAVAALTITPEREKEFDFSHPFLVDGLGIAVPATGERGFISSMSSLFTAEFMKAIGALTLILFAFGFLIWIFERKRNADQFGGEGLKGLGSGFWWSAVTMTTVGYGDKAPQTVPGRLVGIIWMFAAVILISSFTGAISSSLTVNQLGNQIEDVNDLRSLKVGSIAGSTSAGFLDANGIRHFSAGTLNENLQQLADGELDAVVYDAAILNHAIKENFQGEIMLLPQRYDNQHYGIGLKNGSPLRESINRSLLEVMESAEWQAVLKRYL